MLRMGRFVNPGSSAFQTALNSEIYVDKTGLIEYTNRVLGTTDAYICNSRPRRFGKSYAANMLAAYYSKGARAEEMFSNLEIGKNIDFRKHLNRYDVIYIDMQWFLKNCRDVTRMVPFIAKSILKELRESYPGVFPTEEESLPEALSLIREKLGYKFIVIMDDWDILFRDASTDPTVQKKYMRFLSAMFKGLEPTKYIQLTYLTGILPICKGREQTLLNNFDEFTMLWAGPLAPYVGFTEPEVHKLCKQYSQNFAEIKQWYAEYPIGKESVYHPEAIVKIMLENEAWKSGMKTDSYDTVSLLLDMDFDGLKSAILEMISGTAIEMDAGSFQNDVAKIRNKDDIITYFIHLGYLTYDSTFKLAFIPNEAIRREMISIVRNKK